MMNVTQNTSDIGVICLHALSMITPEKCRNIDVFPFSPFLTYQINDKPKMRVKAVLLPHIVRLNVVYYMVLLCSVV